MPKPSAQSQTCKSLTSKRCVITISAYLLHILTISQYLKYLVLLRYNQQINKPDSTNAFVDAFYVNFLKEIFTLKDNFGVEQEARPAPTGNVSVSERPDFLIRYIKNGSFTKVILYEDKKRDGESQSSIWSSALNQVVDSAKSVRQGQRSGETLYLTVNIGTRLRFYELEASFETARDWPPARGRVYELADDEVEVWELWLKLRDAVSSL